MADAWTVIAIGNPLRGDDGVGAAVAERVRGMPGVVHVIGDGDPFEVADLLSGPHNVVLVDATRGGGAPGAISVWEASPGAPARVGSSTHGFGAQAAIDLAAALAPLPDRVVVVGVEGADFDGPALSAPVAAAVDGAVAAVARVVGDA